MNQTIELTGCKPDKKHTYEFFVTLKKSDIILIVKNDECIQVFMKWQINDENSVGYKVYRDTPEKLDDYYVDLVSQWEAFLQYENPYVYQTTL